MCEIVDNYLSSEEYFKLKTLMESNNFPWYFYDFKVKPNNNLFDYQFCHLFYKNNVVNSDFFHHLEPIIKLLKPLSLIRIKANLNPITNKLIKFGTHPDQLFSCKAAIYYLNTNNGYTMIGDKKIESKENRMVLFNADQKHYGTNSTNCNNRMVINFNYF